MKKISQENLNIFYGFACNYSCDGCSSGSDVVDSTEDPDLELALSSIAKLSNLFDVKNMLTLIGGEALLYWQSRIAPLSKEVRKHFPHVKINVFTNGQLIHKHLDQVLDLMCDLGNFDITITRHIPNISNNQPGRIWSKSIDTIANDSRIFKIHDHHYHIRDRIHNNIHITDNNNNFWKSFYRHTTDGKIKPWATNDPVGSMKHGCTGHICTVVFENKIYKCGNLAMLNQNLRARGQQDDPDWQKYLSYMPIDLDDINLDLLSRFSETYGLPTTWCDMCANKIENMTKWHRRTHAMIFTKNHKNK